jgi:hypothetical protein
MLVFYSVYFRLHYYFPFPRFVKRKTRIRAIDSDSRVAEYQGVPVVITIARRTCESSPVSAKEARPAANYAQTPLDNARQ